MPYDRLAAAAPELFSIPGTMLWIGARVPGLHCFPELKAIGHEITILEAWETNIRWLSREEGIDHLVWGDVRELSNIELPRNHYDYAYWYQGPEHVLEEELPDTLAQIEAICDFVLTGASWGFYEQGPLYGNPYEVHLSHLDEPFFHALGYETKTYGEKDVRGSELIAWKRVR